MQDIKFSYQSDGCLKISKSMLLKIPNNVVSKRRAGNRVERMEYFWMDSLHLFIQQDFTGIYCFVYADDSYNVWLVIYRCRGQHYLGVLSVSRYHIVLPFLHSKVCLPVCILCSTHYSSQEKNTTDNWFGIWNKHSSIYNNRSLSFFVIYSDSSLR